MAGVVVWVWQQLVHVLHPLGIPATDYSSTRPTCQLSCSQISDHSLSSSFQWGGTTKQKEEQLVTFLLLQNDNFLPYVKLEPEELLTDLLIQGARVTHRLSHHPHLQHYWPETPALTQVSKPNFIQDNPLYASAGAPDLLTCEKQPLCVIWHTTSWAILRPGEGTPSWPWLLPWGTSINSSHLGKHIAPINIQSPVTVWPKNYVLPLTAHLCHIEEWFTSTQKLLWLTYTIPQWPFSTCPTGLDFMARHGKCATHRNMLIWRFFGHTIIWSW